MLGTVNSYINKGDIYFDVQYRDRDTVRRISGAKYVKDRTWRLPLTWASCIQLRGFFGERLEVSDGLTEWALSEFEERINPATEARELALDPEADIDLGEYFEPMFNFQRTGANFLFYAQSAVLADDMGTGKTFTIIGALELLDAYPALIVAPRTAKRVWADEYKRWAPHRTVTVVDSVGAKRTKQFSADTDVIIVNYESLRTGSRLQYWGSIKLSEKEKILGPLNRDWGAVVADEAHRAKDPHSKQTRALWAVGSTAKHRFAVTGTPVANKTDDFWSLLHFVSPEEWSSRSNYIDRYCNVDYDWHGGMTINGLKRETKDEFYKVIDPRLLRRPKELVAPFLPEKLYEVKYVEMSAKQKKAYNEMVDKHVSTLDDDAKLPAFNPLSVAARLYQFSSSYATLNNNVVELALPSSKVDATVELAQDINGESLVVFAQSKQLINLIENGLNTAGFESCRITGDEDDDQRDKATKRFQAGEIPIILLTLGAGSESITLTRSHILCFAQRSFSFIKNKQATNRVDRIGQKANSILIVDMIAPETIEEKIVPVLRDKGVSMEEVVRDAETLKNLITKER